ncbi:hypothetical protein GF325_11595 [Candidatus Bathyarchaeota archaeon]|nr:hypothetical protein [Candidatus Bathyarchaeota archaeon]
MKIRGKLLKKETETYELRVNISPVEEMVEEIPITEFFDDFDDGEEIEIDITGSEGAIPRRHVVKVKPIQIGMHHYQEVHGSVCSADVESTPPIEPARIEQLDLQIAMRAEALARHDFVRVQKPLVVYTHQDMRRIAQELSMDTDAILVGYNGCNPLEEYYLKQFGIPLYRNSIPKTLLQGMRGKKYLSQSKFIYIGEIPSFSAPEGPWDFFKVQERFGTRFRHVETNEFFRQFDKFSDDEVKHELEKWSSTDFEQVEPNLQEMMNETRVYLALRHLTEREDANGVTVNCGRFTEERPVVPCLAFARLIDEGIICSCEGDITAMLSALMLHGVSMNPILMGNFGSKAGRFEAGDGEVTIEHDVIPLSMAKQKFTVRDYHGRNFGVTGYADAKEGPMTLLNLDPSLEKISVIQGKVIHSVDGIHCRVIIHMKVNGDVKKVPDIVVGSQHMSMCYGHWLEPIREMASLLNLNVISLE